MDVKQAFDAVMANPAAYARSILLTVLVIAALIALFKVGPRLWRAVLAYTGGNRDLTDDAPDLRSQRSMSNHTGR